MASQAPSTAVAAGDSVIASGPAGVEEFPAGPLGSVSAKGVTVLKGLVATLYHLDDLGGEVVAAGIQGLNGTMFDCRDVSNQVSVPVTLPDSGPYVFAVANDITDQSTWSVSFS